MIYAAYHADKSMKFGAKCCGWITCDYPGALLYWLVLGGCNYPAICSSVVVVTTITY